MLDIMWKVLERLQEAWAFKACVSCIFALASHTHVQMAVAFAALVCVDLLTKWLSLSRQYLIDSGMEQPRFWTCLCNIRAAQRAGYILSEEMRTRFVAKMLTYFGVVAAAWLVDSMCVRAGAPTVAVVVVVGYLSVTEMLSILENMERSGVTEAAELSELIRKKSGINKKKEE